MDSIQLLTFAQVAEAVQLGRSAIYSKIRAGIFPSPLHISTRAVRWRVSDIETWIDALPRARDIADEGGAA